MAATVDCPRCQRKSAVVEVPFNKGRYLCMQCHQEVITPKEFEELNKDTSGSASDPDSTSVPLKNSTFQEFIEYIWDEYLKDWLDYASFFRQRKAIMADPEAEVFQSGRPDASRKSPFRFAVQGLLISALVMNFFGMLLGYVITPPEGKVSAEIKRLSEAQHRIKAASGDDIDLSTYNIGFGTFAKEEVVSKLDSEIKTLALAEIDLLKASKFEDAIRSAIQFTFPVTVLLSTYLFSFFLRLGRQGRTASNLEYSHAAYLLLITAYLFWLNIAYQFVMQVVEIIPWSKGDDVGRVIFFTIMAIISIGIWRASVMRVSTKMCSLFKMDPRYGFYHGTGKVFTDILGAEFVAAIPATMILILFFLFLLKAS